MLTTERSYDIDWLRVIAIGLLLAYHIAIGFQPWGIMIGFITTEQPWESLWIPMAMLNVWRIPLLFFVSGMGVYFAMRKRDWKQLLFERSGRILVPFLFGIFAIVPLHLFLFQKHNGFPIAYTYDTGHLWFLGNIFLYVVVLSPLFYYLKTNREGALAGGISRLFAHPLGLLAVILALTAEAMLVKPWPYELYAMTWHGFFLGLLAFFFGFCFVLSGDRFWSMIQKWRWVFIVTALGLYLIRVGIFQFRVPYYQLVPESTFWIFAMLAFGSKYLNRPGKALSYLSQAAYPVYILHMVFLYLGSMVIFPLPIPAYLQFISLLVFTLLGCFAAYEGIRRVPILRPLFGLKIKSPLKVEPAVV